MTVILQPLVLDRSYQTDRLHVGEVRLSCRYMS